MSVDESEIMAARLTIFEAAQDMLAGRLSYIEGARKICPDRFSWGLDEWDADLRCFIGILSETDALQFGEMRAHWQAAALEALQPEIDKKEARLANLPSPIAATWSSAFRAAKLKLGHREN